MLFLMKIRNKVKSRIQFLFKTGKKLKKFSLTFKKIKLIQIKIIWPMNEEMKQTIKRFVFLNQRFKSFAKRQAEKNQILP